VWLPDLGTQGGAIPPSSQRPVSIVDPYLYRTRSDRNADILASAFLLAGWRGGGANGVFAPWTIAVKHETFAYNVPSLRLAPLPDLSAREPSWTLERRSQTSPAAMM